LPGASEATAGESSTHAVGLPYRFKMLKSRVLRKLFRSEGKGAMRRCRKLYIEELHGLYSSSNIIRVIRLTRRRWMESVAAWKRREIHAGF